MKVFYRCIRFLFKVYFCTAYRLKVYGKENIISGRAILAPNHTSFLDPPLVGVSCPEEIHFLARKSLFKNKFFKFAISHLNAYPISNEARDLQTLKLICQLLQEDKKVVIFPEGIRSFDGKMTEIKSGIGMLALRCQAPIIPTYIAGGYEIWNRKRRFPKLWGNIRCVFGPPIYPHEFDHLDKKNAQDEIAKRVKNEIEALRISLPAEKL